MPRKQYSTEFKAKVALEAIKGIKTINELQIIWSPLFGPAGQQDLLESWG